MRHSYIDGHSNIDSFLHRRDPRVKIVCFLVFILFIVSTRPESFSKFYLYGLLLGILIFLSKIPLAYILKRSVVIVPFVLMMAIFIPFLKKGRIAGGYSFGTLRLTVTYDGLMVLWNVLIKAYLSILCTILLMSSVKISDLLKALEKLRCPKLITMIVSFMYRYIFIFQDELIIMQQAKAARSVGGRRWFQIKTLANMIGMLFVRAYERGESVYLAMCSRGFDGKIRTLDDFKLKRGDLFFFLIIAILLLSIRLWGN